MIDPADRSKRRGLLINITGNGKGKTTSAMGTAVRALGWGWQVKFLQFVKNDGPTGEKQFFAALPNIEFSQVGLGLSWTPGDHATAAQAGWEEAKNAILSEKFDLIVLDELNIALKLGWLPAAAVIEVLRAKPVHLHLIVTGRQALPELIEVSDLVSEITAVKHPFSNGIPAQPGIEY